jgi:TolB-like protein
MQTPGMLARAAQGNCGAMSAEQDREPALSRAAVPARAVFLSYASEDLSAAERIASALRAAGIEVWIDKSELRGGDAWDQSIRKQIKACALFIPIISRHAHERIEGYFRLEWKLAVDRSHLLASDQAFLLPVTIDDTPQSDERIPDRFRELQWTCLPAGETTPGFIERVRRLLLHEASSARVTVAPVSLTSTVRASGGPVGPPWWSKVGLWVTGAVLAVALAYFVVDKLWISRHVASSAASTVAARSESAAIPEKSVAVLPFLDMSQKKDQEYFSDGLSEELIDRLAHSPDLKVIARTSSFQFKSSRDDVRTIGQKLGVANVLEGSVRTSGKRLRVTAQLINASDGSHRWSETYDRDIGDVFEVQDSIAAAVVTALKAAIAASTSPPYRPKSTDAYNAYLRGDYFLRKHNAQDAELALASYEEAIRLDPRYADAWVGVAYVYNERGLRGWMPSKEAYVEARKAIDQAFSIDPNLAAAYLVVAYLEYNFTFDFQKGRTAFKRARDLDPTAVEDNSIELWDALGAGRLEESIALGRQVVQRNPLSASRLEDLALVLWFANRLSESERTFRHLLELDSSFSAAHCELGEVLLSEKKPDAALSIMSEEADPDSKWCLADALWALGRRTDADAFLAGARAKYADTQAFQIAQSYALRGDKDEAFKWLNHAYDNREPALYVVGQSPMLGNLRDDPRFAAFVQKMNLPK